MSALVIVALYGAAVGRELMLTGSATERDSDMCLADDQRIPGVALFLFDLRKPLDRDGWGLPGDLLHSATGRLERDTEIRVFAVSNSPRSPSVQLWRVCKPYAASDLAVSGARDHRGGQRDCEDVPRSLPPHLRQMTAQFCDERETLQRRLYGLVAARGGRTEPLDAGYLVEAIEAVTAEIADRPGKRLYVFSDMMQHADWYSHLDTDWEDWHDAGLVDTSAVRRPGRGVSRPLEGFQVDVFYVPRRGMTARADTRRRHQALWQRYFAGASVRYHNQSPMDFYKAERRMPVVSGE